MSGLCGVAGSSGKGGNSAEGRLRQAREGRLIRMVADQALTPTYMVDGLDDMRPWQEALADYLEVKKTQCDS
jgi:hypothetical protein